MKRLSLTAPLFAALLLIPPNLPAQDAPPAPAAVAPTDTVITSIKGEVWSPSDDETRGLFTGNVIVVGTNIRLTCDRLEVIAAGKTEPTATIGKIDRFKYLLATGKVHITQGDRDAHAERAEFFPREDKIILSGNPIVVDHTARSTATGEPMTFLRGERRVLGENVRFTFPPIKDLGPDKNAPAPKPDEPAAPAPTK